MPQKIKPLAFTAQEIDGLTDQWSDLEIAFRYKLAYSAVRKARITHGVKTFTQKTGLVKIGLTGELRRKGSVRGAVRDDGLVEDYFTRIDSPQKAYWLGLLMADGWVTLRGGVPKEVGLALKADDAYLLEEWQRAIGHTGRLVYKVNRRSLKRDNHSTIATVRVTGQRFTACAIEAGIKPRKSGNLSLPEGAYAYPADFCRGYFDGDGSISYKNFTFICNSVEFQKQLCNLIEVETGSRLRKAALPSPVTGKAVERLSGYMKDASVLHWMYSNAKPCLARKYDIYHREWC